MLLTTIEVAKLLAVTPEAVYRWRKEDRGPGYMRLHYGERECIRYHIKDVEEYLKTRVVFNALNDKRSRLLTPKEVSMFLGISINRLGTWRYRDKGPKYYRLEGAIRYKADEVMDYINNRQVLTEGARK